MCMRVCISMSVCVTGKREREREGEGEEREAYDSFVHESISVALLNCCITISNLQHNYFTVCSNTIHKVWQQTIVGH